MNNDFLSLQQQSIGLRDGIPVEKGVVLNEDRILANEELFRNWLEFFIMYPDLFLDMIKPKDVNFDFYFYQRIILRAIMRYRYVTVTLTRAGAKSFLMVIGLYLICTFLPDSKIILCSDVKGQSVKILTEKLHQLWALWPLLERELEEKHMSNDYVRLRFKNGATFQVVGMKNADRGLRSTGGGIEEAALMEGDNLTSVIIPMMNVSRRTRAGKVNPREPHQRQIFVTSAGSRTCDMYSKLVELIVKEVNHPEDVFNFGGDYRLPVLHGLIDQKAIDEQRFSSTFSEQVFAREALSIWTGANEDCWFSSDTLSKRRILLKAERAANFNVLDKKQFYLLAVDVGRYGETNTVIVVFKVNPKQDHFHKNVVYIESLNNIPLDEQSIKIKQMAQRYSAREIVIDGNGLGAGIIDTMVKPSFELKTGALYPAYYVFNDPKYPYLKSESDKAIIYNIKANQSLNSEIHSNCYVELSNGHVSLLAHERVVREKLLKTSKGRTMEYFEREQFLMPYILTSRLISEMENLRLRNTGNNNLVDLEQVNKRIPKDVFSALEYGLFRLKALEKDFYVARKKSRDFSDFVMFSSKRQRR